MQNLKPYNTNVVTKKSPRFTIQHSNPRISMVSTPVRLRRWLVLTNDFCAGSGFCRDLWLTRGELRSGNRFSPARLRCRSFPCRPFVAKAEVKLHSHNWLDTLVSCCKPFSSGTLDGDPSGSLVFLGICVLHRGSTIIIGSRFMG